MGRAPDVLVIGGGIIGLTAAYDLAAAGLTVEVLDRGELAREASWAGAGILPPGNFARAATAIDRLRALGAERFPRLSAEMHEVTGIDNGYLRCGGVEFLDAADSDVLPLWRAEGIVYERLTVESPPVATGGLRPPPGTTPYHLPDLAQVRNPWHLRALAVACRRRGVALSPHTPALGWELAAGRVVGLRTPAGTKSASHYVVAAGAWADELLTLLGTTAGVVPVRGQIIVFQQMWPQLLTQVLMHGKRYVVPRADGRTLIGSTEEPDAGFEKATTKDAVRDLSAFATALVPTLNDCPIDAAWAGLRPGSPDGLPVLGFVPGYDNVIAACGHFRAGVQLSPGTAAVVVALVTGTRPPVSLDAFLPGRVPKIPAAAAFRS